MDKRIELQVLEPIGFENLPIQNPNDYKIFSFIIGNLWIQNSLDENTEYELDVGEYAKTFGIERDSAVKFLKENLLNVKLFEVPTEELNELLNYPEEYKLRLPNMRSIFSAFYGIVVEDSTRIRVRFHPYLCFLYNKIASGELYYFKTRLTTIVEAKSFHTIRLTRILNRHKFKRKWEVSVEHLRKLMELKDSYQEFKVFSRSILIPSIEEINAQQKLFVEVEYIKDGRAVVGLRFKIKNLFKKPRRFK